MLNGDDLDRHDEFGMRKPDVAVNDARDGTEVGIATCLAACIAVQSDALDMSRLEGKCPKGAEFNLAVSLADV